MCIDINRLVFSYRVVHQKGRVGKSLFFDEKMDSKIGKQANASIKN